MFRITKKEAELIAELFCFSRGLYKMGKYTLNSKSKELINSYWHYYKYENKDYQKRLDVKARNGAEYMSLSEFF